MNETKNTLDVPVLMKQQWGQYQIIESVKYGRFTKAYLGEHPEHPGKQFVVEIFPLTLTANESTAFLQSGHSLMQLVHPSILRLMDVGINDTTPFIVLEAIPHIPLSQSFLRGQSQPLETLLPYLRKIVDALHHAHTQGHIHKQLQPNNVLLAPNDTTLLCNFAIDGLASNELFQSYQRHTFRIEPLVYMAPEQIQQQAMKASDQYALAIMIYEWLCGHPPFLGTSAEITQQQLHRTPQSMHQQVPGIPRNIEEVVMIALDKDPDKRFGNIKAFMNALEQAYALTKPGDQRESAPPASERVAPPVLAQVSAASTAMAPSPATPPSPTIQPQPMTAGDNSIEVPTLANSANVEQSLTPHTTQPSAPSAPPRAKQQQSKNTTRRAMLISAASVAVTGGVGSWLLWNRLRPHPHSTSVTTANTIKKPIAGQSVVYSVHTARVNAVAWSPDSQKVASASDDRLVLICDRAGHTLLTYSGHTDHVNTVAWSPNGDYIASGSADNTVQIWNATTGQLVFAYTGHTNAVNAVGWSADNRLIASGSDDKTVQAWFALPTDTGTLGESFLTYRSPAGHTAAVTCVTWSPNNSIIASSSWDNTLQACSVVQNDAFAVGDRIFSAQIHGDNVIYTAAWSPDRTVIACGGGDNLVQLCDGTTGSTANVGFRSPNIPRHDKPVRSLSWSPDGNFIVSGGDDRVARIWDATSGKPTDSFANHSDSVLAVAWSPDGSLVASGSADTTVQLWKPS